MPLLLGLVLLGVIVLLLNWYAEADVKSLKSSLRWTGILLGLIVVAFLAATGRLAVAVAFLGGMVAWAWRVFGIVQMARTMGSHFGGKSARGAPSNAGDAAMDKAEALRVLGLAAGATEDDIKAAHRRLMAQIHPDVGGSDYLAGKINTARDVLLGKRR